MKTTLLTLLIAATVTSASAIPNLWINEFHYDNTGTDTGEFIEVAGPAGTDLTGFSILLYNGSGGAVYDTDALSGLIPDQQNGFGTVVIYYPSNGIQNGAPDGIALVDASNAVIQFLSYEGTFTAVGGPANGMLSTQIGVSQNGTEPIGSSLHLVGTGTSYADFTWASTEGATPGRPNARQTFGAPPVPDTGSSALLLSIPLLGLLALHRFTTQNALIPARKFAFAPIRVD